MHYLKKGYINGLGFILTSFFFLFASCVNKKKIPALFEVRDDNYTGLHFTNKLLPTDSFNMFNYMYFYNGSGVAAGDFNNDGKVDLFFSSNMGENKLYLNKGQLKFEDVTDKTMLAKDNGWSTGVSVVDINNDGLLDIYVSKVGKYEILNSKNQLLICKGLKDGIPFYKDEAAAYGLDFSGFSTQAAFFDYDMDGDLDMFLLNHAVHQNGTFAPRKNFIGTYDSLSGDRLFKNTEGHFKDVTKESMINSSAIGYGLGIVVSDINMDGWPDIYIGNDFHENDYLYINQKDGTFSEEGTKQMMHTSMYSMGVDAADANNDGYPEIISADMLPSDPYILKRSLGEDDYDIYNHKIDVGYSYQYTRNNLQYNRRNGSFSEVGLYAGVYATDWSWSPLWIDFDNDGLKDLFISNGIPKRMNDIDYVKFVSSEDIQKDIKENKKVNEALSLADRFPEIKIPNRVFKNNGDLKFLDQASSIKNDKPTFSNGAVYADLDNDGDLDIVVNNINDPALVYENRTNTNDTVSKSVSITLKGPNENTDAIGARVFVFTGKNISTYEKYPVRGFESSMEIPIHIGLGSQKIDSAFLIWPDMSFQKIDLTKAGTTDTAFTYIKELPGFNFDIIKNFNNNTVIGFTNITEQSGIKYYHKENFFPEFSREPLIPHKISSEGPALAVADINNDGLEDVFIGSSKSYHNAIFIQQSNGHFIKTDQPAMLLDSMYEDVDAAWADVNNDGFTDLLLATGGNEYYGKDQHLLPRIYLNDGKSHFTKLNGAFSNVFVTPSCITPCDFNNDGNIDVFIGGRSVPWNYGVIPQSYLMMNDGKGIFTDVTSKYAKELTDIGMVTGAAWCDADKDGDNDLLVCCEWGGIYAFINNKGIFNKKELTNKKGWWNFIKPVDIDNDGDIDLVAGNLGLNSRLTASEDHPVRLYYNDFDNNGKKEQILTYYLAGKEIPFANKDEIEKQTPSLKKKFLLAADFAKASITDLFTKEKLSTASVLTADYFSNAVFINDGQLNFSAYEIPWEAQLTSYRDAVITDVNNDKLPEIILMGNFNGNNIQMGNYDAGFGTVMINKGNGLLEVQNNQGWQIKGDVRHIQPITINKSQAYILARNNDSTLVVEFSKIKN